MFFRQDWLMRQIDMFIQELAHLLGEEIPDPFSEELEDYGTAGEADPFGAQLNALVHAGRINEAENLLFEKIGDGDHHYIKQGLDFYALLNQKSDDYLELHGFSREEIREGLEDFGRVYGIDLK